MITGIYLTVSLALVVITFFITDFYFMFRYDRERTSGKGWSLDYTLFVLGLGVLVVVQPVLFPIIGFFTIHPLGLVVQIFGLLLILFSFAVHIWSRLHLQKFYTERVEFQPDHKVIDTGPYALVRHPLVSSFFLLGTGVFLFAPAVTTLLVMVYVYWDFHRAALQEETLLCDKLDDYKEYMKRVPRFVPRLKI